MTRTGRVARLLSPLFLVAAAAVPEQILGARVERVGARVAGQRQGNLRMGLQRHAQPLPLLVLVDVSGSMERYSRLLLSFLHAATRDVSGQRARRDVFAFGTHLTDLTPAFRLADTDAMLARIEALSQATGDAVRGLLSARGLELPDEALRQVVVVDTDVVVHQHAQRVVGDPRQRGVVDLRQPRRRVKIPTCRNWHEHRLGDGHLFGIATAG